MANRPPLLTRTFSGQACCFNPDCHNSNQALFEERFCFTTDHEEAYDYWECLKCHETAAKMDWNPVEEYGIYEGMRPSPHSISLYTSDGQSFHFYDQDSKSPNETNAHIKEEESSRGSESNEDENTSPKEWKAKFLRPCQCGNNDFRRFKPVLDTNGQDVTDLVYCLDCGDCQGMDDTLSIFDFQGLLEKGRITTTPCKECANNDIDEFTFTEIDEEFGLQCNICGTMVEEDENQDNNIYPDGDSDDSDKTNTVQLSDLTITCRCGNKDLDSMFVIVNGDEEVTQLECECGLKLNLDEEESISCPFCPNTELENFTYCPGENGSITNVKCGQCNLSFCPGESQASCRQGTCGAASQTHCELKRKRKEPPILPKTRIKSLDELKPGDHIAWHRRFGYWHHALVVEYGYLSGQLKVIEYHGLIWKGIRIIAKAEIMEHWIKTDPRKEYIYRINYEPGECFPVKETLKRAKKHVGERRYNLLKSNCEHFVKTCKTGECTCSQKKDVKSAFKRFGLKILAILAKKGVRVGFKVAAPSLQGVLGAVAHEGAHAASDALLAGGLVVLFEAISLVNFIKEVNSMRKRGQISREAYVNAIISRVTQGITSVGCAAAGSIVGSLLIPLPFIGSFVGCTFGMLIGYILSPFLGRQIIGLKDEAIEIKDKVHALIKRY